MGWSTQVGDGRGFFNAKVRRSEKGTKGRGGSETELGRMNGMKGRMGCKKHKRVQKTPPGEKGVGRESNLLGYSWVGCDRGLCRNFNTEAQRHRAGAHRLQGEF